MERRSAREVRPAEYPLFLVAQAIVLCRLRRPGRTVCGAWETAIAFGAGVILRASGRKKRSHPPPSRRWRVTCTCQVYMAAEYSQPQRFVNSNNPQEYSRLEHLCGATPG
jgi:hypothetical protein